MAVVQVNGIDLYYEEAGSGHPLLLIVGLGGNALDWTPHVPVLGERFRVIAFDNRRVGRSSEPRGPYSTRQMADDAVALLDHLGIDRAHVLGASLGGAIAQELALGYPERVARLMLVSSLARPGPEWFDRWLEFWIVAGECDIDPAIFDVMLMPWALTPAFMVQPDQVDAVYGEWQSAPYRATAQGIVGQVAAVRIHDAIARLPGITASTLVLVGAEDCLTPPVLSQEIAAAIPNARLHILERGGHVALWEY
jgi:pimeloyl-ACP methyl ester carboxylesterase